MKKIFKKITSLVGGLALAVGVSSPVVASQPNLKQKKETSQITESSPLYLQHSINLLQNFSCLSVSSLAGPLPIISSRNYLQNYTQQNNYNSSYNDTSNWILFNNVLNFI